MEKVTDEDLQKLQKFRERLMEMIITIGENHLTTSVLQEEIKTLNLLKEQVENEFKEFRKQETIMFEEFTKKYGTSNIDLATGNLIK